MATTAALAARLERGDATGARRELAAVGPEGREDVLDALARAAAGGSTLATELLVEELDRHGTVRAAVRRFLFDEDAVDDVTQDTLVGVAAGIRGFRGDARCTTWVFSIARHRVTDHLRRSRATVALDGHDVGDAVRLSSMIASRAAVRQLLDRLPEPYGEVVRLRDVDGLDHDTIARRTGRNVNTVRSQIARGRALVAGMLPDELRGGR